MLIYLHGFDFFQFKIENNKPFFFHFKETKMDKTDQDFITASAIRNHILQDPICDYFQYHPSKFEKQEEPEFIKKNLESGIEYEKEVFSYLQSKYKVEVVATKPEDLYDKDLYEKTLQLMREKTPIIYQAIVINYDKKIGGICDLLIHSPVFNEIVSENQGTYFINEKEDHYVAVDIKASRLLFTKDGLHLQNSRNFIFYKAQVCMYNEALNYMQSNFVTHCAYILGRGWQIGQEKGTNALQRMARVDFYQDDSFITERVWNAVEWLRNLRRNKDVWILHPPSTLELRPNMKVESAVWQKAKQKVAEEQEDVTLLYYCGAEKRDRVDETNISSWKKVAPQNLEIKSEKILKTIDREIKVNKKKSFEILPMFFSDYSRLQLKPHQVELYLDYETFVYRPKLETIQNIEISKTIVYVIGCGIVRNNTWTFSSFFLDNLSEEAQQKLFSDWFTHCIQPLQETNIDFQIYSWGTTEKNYYEKTTRDTSLFSEKNYTDLLQVLRNESVAMSGLSGYSLKKMAHAMHKGGCIQTIWTQNTEIQNGAGAMIQGEKLYLEEKEEDAKEEIKKNILQYNEVDCKVMWEISNYFRACHC